MACELRSVRKPKATTVCRGCGLSEGYNGYTWDDRGEKVDWFVKVSDGGARAKAFGVTSMLVQGVVCPWPHA